MEKDALERALKQTYNEFEPFSWKYRVDFDRYNYSLKLLSSVGLTNKKIVDVGTGIGIVPATLKKMDPSVQAVGLDRYIFPDSNSKMFGIPEIETLKKIWKKSGIEILNADIYDSNIPEKVRGADILLNEATIEHVKDPKRFLLACRTLLKDGGYLLISTPNCATLLKRLRFLFGKSPYWPIESFFEDGELFTGHWREYTRKELVSMCETAGFEVLETYTKNVLTKFKALRHIKRNLRALVSLLSSPFPGMREMHYVLCRKT